MDLRAEEGTALSGPVAALVAAHDAGESAAAGLDHNYVLCDAQTETNVLAGGSRTQRLAAVCTDPTSGRRLRVTTDAPGVQCFTANCKYT